MSRDAVVWAYKLFLRREPESEAVIDKRMEAGNVFVLIKDIVHFAEFSNSGWAHLVFPDRPGAKKRLWERWLGTRVAAVVYRDSITPDAVTWAYRFLLGRDPESEAVIAEKLRVPNYIQLLRLFVRSSEFAARDINTKLFAKDQGAIGATAGERIPARPQAQAKLTVLVLGNCQAPVLGNLLEAMVPGLTATSILLLPKTVERILLGEHDLTDTLAMSSLILIGGRREAFECDLIRRYPEAAGKVRRYPTIGFSAFHPDIVYAAHRGDKVISPMIDYNSALTLWAWKSGFDAKETVGLFRREVFQHLGYFDYLESSRAALVNDGLHFNMPLDALLEKWLSKGCFMHSMNHPKSFVIADMAREMLTKEKIGYFPGAENYLPDPLANEYCWPVYPEIAKALGIQGHYYFKLRSQALSNDKHLRVIGLDQFVDESFRSYSRYSKEEVICERLNTERFQTIGNFLKAERRGSIPRSPTVISKGGQSSPYSNLPDHQFWRRAIEQQAANDVDPVVAARFTIGRSDRIATAGSCFAQHISKTLTKHGCNYFVVEEEKGLQQAAARPSNHGVFSARYGNIYSARQLLQLLDRAYGRFVPAEQAWVRTDRNYADPFRPQIEPHGYPSPAQLEQSRTAHLAGVRDMFEKLDVFVFTLGLTEVWRSKSDGAVFPLAPGVVAGEMDDNKYEFVNFEADQIIADLQKFVAGLYAVNPRARIILTVSPVPLIATFEKRHVLVSTIYSKSALRAAAEVVTRRHANCDYFPSYEIITGNYARGKYFEEDLRAVTASGVDHVMRLFRKHYLAKGESAGSPALHRELMSEAARISGIVCDEEALDSAG